MMKTVLPDMTVRTLHPAQRALVAGCRLAGLLAALALPACSENIRQREQDISDARERYRQILEEQQIVQAINARAGRIEVSKEKAWLYQPYSASYSDGLRQTLPRIVPYPITYAIRNDYNPKVNSTTQATTVEDHLDAISLQANVGYQFHEGTLLITPTVTRKYEVPLYGGGNNTIGIGTDNLNVGNEPGGSYSNSLFSDISPLNDVYQLVGATLGISACNAEQQTSESVSRQEDTDAVKTTKTTTTKKFEARGGPLQIDECYSVSPSGNLLIITARPQRQVLFESVYREWLKAVTRQANVKITTIRLDVTQLAQQQVDISVIRNAAISAGFGNVVQTRAGGALSSPVIGGNDKVFSLQLSDDGSPWNTSQVILKALERIGNVSVEDSRELLLHNNRLITLRDYHVERYVKQISVELNTTGNTSVSTPSVEIDQLQTGQAINILPTLTDDLIAMHVVINEARVDSRVNYSIGGTEGVLPQNSGADSIFDVTLKHNEAVLLASTTRTETNASSERAGMLPIWPLNLVNGGGAQGRQRVIQTLYLIEAGFKS